MRRRAFLPQKKLGFFFCSRWENFNGFMMKFCWGYMNLYVQMIVLSFYQVVEHTLLILKRYGLIVWMWMYWILQKLFTENLVSTFTVLQRTELFYREPNLNFTENETHLHRTKPLIQKCINLLTFNFPNPFPHNLSSLCSLNPFKSTSQNPHID